jgi:hypothetical protein
MRAAGLPDAGLAKADAVGSVKIASFVAEGRELRGQGLVLRTSCLSQMAEDSDGAYSPRGL